MLLRSAGRTRTTKVKKKKIKVMAAMNKKFTTIDALIFLSGAAALARLVSFLADSVLEEVNLGDDEHGMCA